MSPRLELHAARMRLRHADLKLQELSKLPKSTAEQREARHEAFREFWKQVARDDIVVKADRAKERTRRLRQKAMV